MKLKHLKHGEKFILRTPGIARVHRVEVFQRCEEYAQASVISLRSFRARDFSDNQEVIRLEDMAQQ